MTRYEQRRYAEQIKSSPHRAQMAAEVGSETTFAHYIRTDRSGARPVPRNLLEAWVERGWLDRVLVPEGKQPDPVPGWVLDPFVGSGTSLGVCRELGVNGAGLDISPQYLDEHAKVRIGQTPANALDQLPLFEGLT